jgi:hypothetical protein
MNAAAPRGKVQKYGVDRTAHEQDKVAFFGGALAVDLDPMIA